MLIFFKEIVNILYSFIFLCMSICRNTRFVINIQVFYFPHSQKKLINKQGSIKKDKQNI